ncbi:uncharacterized protein LOC122651530 [Telopea speciosissima]|uniref:uncharacterized protein LOC122651530 n=1 Tax=Telopea speciosissima TaxID=54955 RepID=UPI001CC34F92|nr:uncharacterized protein LOC122651530 [Telopea speciosissima]XP_043700876.1 uncharacterized protein LOC122651530 [Telopea speciosissima]
MRFKKGSKVEVLSKKEVPSGAWRCAEIISGNGHNYDVTYDWTPATTDEVAFHRVSRKAIRPSPPLVEGANDWVPGDLVEVFDNNSWRIASISKVMGGNRFVVRLLGSLGEFRVHKSDLRVRQSWIDNKWVVVGKGSAQCEDGKSNKLSTSRFYEKLNFQAPLKSRTTNLCAGDGPLPDEYNRFQESHMVSSRTRKRGSPYCSSHVDALTGANCKLRLVEKDGRRERLITGHPSPVLGKVDAVAYPREMLGEKYMHSSFNNRTTRYSEMDMEMGTQNGDIGCFVARSLEPNDAESSASSVGSCSSGSNSPYELHTRSLTDPSQDRDSTFDDAESFCGWGSEERSPLPTKEELAAEIHTLELHAYRCTIEALYASGPLSWEQETLVTNLRLSLHISNDEHLRELRNLVSYETNFAIS